MLNKLRVLARGNLLVLDTAYASAPATQGQRSYVGRETVRKWKEADLPKDCPRHIAYNEFLEPGQKTIPHSAYPKTGHPVKVPNDSYFRKMVRTGALWAADEETALACGVKFDPLFGGEYPELNTAKTSGKE